MELAYVWVERFRNIVQQGFNISSTYQFEYDVNKNFLNITERANKLDNFFEQKAIVNVTALIGQNASGKTNVLELINYALCDGNTKIVEPFFMILCDKDKFTIVRHRTDRFVTNVPGKIGADENYSDKLYLNGAFFSNVFDGRRHNFGKYVHDLSANKLLQNQFGENVLTNIKKDIQNQIKFINSDDFLHLQRIEDNNNPQTGFSLKPDRVILTSPTWTNILAKAKAFDTRITRILKDDYTDFQTFCRTFRKKITNSESGRSLYYFTAFLLYVDFIINDFAPQVGGEIAGEKVSKEKEERILKFEEFTRKDTGIKQLKEELLKLRLQQLDEGWINEIHRIITGEVMDYIHNEFPKARKKSDFLFQLGKIDYEFSEKYDEGTYTDRKVQFKADYNREIESFINSYLESTTNSRIMFTIDWDGISSGHKAYINLFSRFSSIKKKIKTDSVLITLDEGDLYFHPKWQTEYLYKLLKILPVIFPDKKIQLILTTHSPFLVSDLTKNNLIFLRRDGEQCTVIPNEDIEGNTFGGNIGELYLDAFFLHGRLISHFAAEKINNLARRISEGNPLTEPDRTLINSIGEEMIKIQLEQMLHDKGSR
jgi:predicted ATP-dependent endonuclease of OLD family